MRVLGVVLAVSGVQSSFAQYCAGGPTSSLDSNLGLSSFIGENSISYTPPCPGVLGVDDQTSRVLILRAGKNYTSSSIRYTSCSSNYPFAGSAWIDFNFNQIWEANELISSSSGTPPVIAPASIIVPQGAHGLTRMRVSMREGGSLPSSPCATFTWGSVVDFGVRIEQGYCAEGGPSSSDDSHLNAFTLFGSGSALSYSRPCPGALGVEDRTDLTTTIERGFGHRTVIDVTTCSLAIASAVVGWIDYNQDQIFDSDEVAFQYRAMPTATTVVITVPHTATLGATRVRVMVKEGGALPLDPCESFTWGSVVDFSVTVTDPSADAPTLADTADTNSEFGEDPAASLLNL